TPLRPRSQRVALSVGPCKTCSKAAGASIPDNAYRTFLAPMGNVSVNREINSAHRDIGHLLALQLGKRGAPPAGFQDGRPEHGKGLCRKTYFLQLYTSATDPRTSARLPEAAKIADITAENPTAMKLTSSNGKVLAAFQLLFNFTSWVEGFSRPEMGSLF